MSILIKGIDLPKKNQLYQIEVHPDGHCSIMTIENGECYELELHSEKEAIQIDRPHGRLIDGDEFKSWVDDWYDCTDIGNIVESWIDERPTILEAEE